MKSQQKTLTLWIVVILMLALVAKMVSQNKQDSRMLTYSSFVKHLEAGQVGEVTFKGKNTIISNVIRSGNGIANP